MYSLEVIKRINDRAVGKYYEKLERQGDESKIEAEKRVEKEGKVIEFHACHKCKVKPAA